MKAGIDIELAPAGWALLRMSSPGRRNALTLTMLDALSNRLDELVQQEDCAVIALRGASGDFTSGRDVAELAQAGRDLHHDLLAIERLLRTIRQLPKPFVTIVDGYALGLGAAMVALSDLALAAADAKIGFPEIRAGILPTFTTASLLDSIPPRFARRLLFTGDMLSGSEAAQIGLASLACPTAGLDAAADSLLSAMAAPGAQAAMRLKGLMRSLADAGDFERALALAREASIEDLGRPRRRAASD